MDKVLHCDCGFEARAEREDALAAVVQRHAWEAHRMALSDDEALLLVHRAQPGEKAPPRKPGRDATSDPSGKDKVEEMRSTK